MHLADGIVSHAPTLAGAAVVSAAGVAWALRRAPSVDRGAAWTGSLAAFVLAAQAINIPLVPGASAHAIGAGLVTLVLGPARALLALTAVVLVQALVLADGGVTTLGVNLVNVALLPVACVHVTRQLLGERNLAATAVIGTLAGNVAGAASLALLLSLGTGAPLALTAGWLVGVQALAGLCEGTLTALAVTRLRRRAPGLLSRPESEGTAVARRRLAWACVAVGVAAALVPFASSTPDALEALLTRVQATP